MKVSIHRHVNFHLCRGRNCVPPCTRSRWKPLLASAWHKNKCLVRAVSVLCSPVPGTNKVFKLLVSSLSGARSIPPLQHRPDGSVMAQLCEAPRNHLPAGSEGSQQLNRSWTQGIRGHSPPLQLSSSCSAQSVRGFYHQPSLLAPYGLPCW